MLTRCLMMMRLIQPATYVLIFPSGAVSCKSSKQSFIAKSTLEYEFTNLELAGHEVEWLRGLLEGRYSIVAEANSINIYAL